MACPHATRLLSGVPSLAGQCVGRMTSTRLPCIGGHSRTSLPPTHVSQTCLQSWSRCIHSGSVLGVAKARNTKKKLVKPIQINAKGIKLAMATIQHDMTVEEVARAINKDVDHVFEVLMYINNGDLYEEETSVIRDFDIIKEIVRKSGMKFKMATRKERSREEEENKDIVRQPPPDPSVLAFRPPVVTIMGHVDHGKTTLLDALHKSNIVDQEFGGITQHIGAFSVRLESGEAITFLDTPGHAAFSAMRARGAQVTDIVVLVIAADDGVMNQTKESIQHAKDANVPIIVAINKVDKHEADIERTKKMLLEHDVVLEDFGGDVQSVTISALKGTNIKQLQEAIVMQAELMDLKADPKGLVEGRVIESQMDAGRGKLATAVVQRGTLKRGDLIVAGTTWAKVRGMFSDQGVPIQQAPPSTPVQIIGWKELPSAGDEILQASSMQVLRDTVQWRKDEEQRGRAREDYDAIAEKRQEHDQVYKRELQKRRELGHKRSKRVQKQKEVISVHDGPQLSIVLKGDVDGSLEAIMDTLDTYRSKKCRLDLVHFGIGNVTESDVELAKAFQGEIFSFNVQTPPAVVSAARSKSVPIRNHNVIYKLFDQLIDSLSSRLPTLEEEEVVGEAEVKAVFHVTEGKVKIPVAGCRCIKGSLFRKKPFKVFRGDEVVYDGTVSSMKHFKNEVETIKNGSECGISVDDRSFIFQAGDVIRCYDIKVVEQDIDWQPGF